MSGTIASVLAFPTTSVANEDDLTIVRTRGELLVFLDAQTQVDSGFSYAFGMCIVTQNAAGVGVTAIPAPSADLAWDGWFVHLQGTVFASVADPVGNVKNTHRYQIDSKAMRKMHLTDTVVAVFETFAELGTAEFSASFESRLLLKLP